MTDNDTNNGNLEDDPQGYVSEMFRSVQGEGPYVGQAQLFLRTAGCRETCIWCDTVYSKGRPRTCAVTPSDGGEPYALPNPMTAAAAVRALLGIEDGENDNGRARVVSITGGEPLEQPGFVRGVAERLQRAGRRVYLETNGVHGAALAEVLPHTDVVAMDIKLPSAMRAPLWDAHVDFLSRFAGTAFDPRCRAPANGGERDKDVFVKVVIDANSRCDEVERAAAAVAAAGRTIPLVLQPESGLLIGDGAGERERAALAAKLAEFRQVASAKLDNVRVMPQVHKLLNIR